MQGAAATGQGYKQEKSDLPPPPDTASAGSGESTSEAAHAAPSATLATCCRGLGPSPCAAAHTAGSLLGLLQRRDCLPAGRCRAPGGDCKAVTCLTMAPQQGVCIGQCASHYLTCWLIEAKARWQTLQDAIATRVLVSGIPRDVQPLIGAAKTIDGRENR